MMNFETITELEILGNAYQNLLDKWAREQDRLQRIPDSPVARHWEAKYWSQIKELEARIIILEHEA